MLLYIANIFYIKASTRAVIGDKCPRTGRLGLAVLSLWLYFSNHSENRAALTIFVIDTALRIIKFLTAFFVVTRCSSQYIRTWCSTSEGRSEINIKWIFLATNAR